jgi:hypothetical protein
VHITKSSTLSSSIHATDVVPPRQQHELRESLVCRFLRKPLRASRSTPLEGIPGRLLSFETASCMRRAVKNQPPSLKKLSVVVPVPLPRQTKVRQVELTSCSPPRISCMPIRRSTWSLSCGSPEPDRQHRPLILKSIARQAHACWPRLSYCSDRSGCSVVDTEPSHSRTWRCVSSWPSSGARSGVCNSARAIDCLGAARQGVAGLAHSLDCRAT